MIFAVDNLKTKNQFGNGLLPEELEAINQLKTIPIECLNISAIAIATNIYRSAQGLKLKMERQVLSQSDLSWTAFSLLYDMWIWGPIEVKNLAISSGVTKATVSNILNTLERKQLCFKKTSVKDRRMVYVHLTEKGRQIIQELYPQFHKIEVDIVSGLSLEEQHTMSQLLRKIIKSNNF